jgi:hypothetical protein
MHWRTQHEYKRTWLNTLLAILFFYMGGGALLVFLIWCAVDMGKARGADLYLQALPPEIMLGRSLTPPPADCKSGGGCCRPHLQDNGEWLVECTDEDWRAPPIIYDPSVPLGAFGTYSTNYLHRRWARMCKGPARYDATREAFNHGRPNPCH